MLKQKPLLEIVDLKVEAEGKILLSDIELTIYPGEIHVIFGPNGSGKSTLIKTIMGIPPYRVVEGDIRFQGKSILDLPIHERAKLGIGLAFQQPPAVPAVSLKALAAALGVDEEKLVALAGELGLSGHLERGINHGFSGGEQKKSELLQLLLQKPRLLLLDEPESGVDVDNIKLVAGVISRLFERYLPIRARRVGGIIVTHTGAILQHLHANRGYIMIDGRITCSGAPLDIFDQISRKGFAQCIAEARAELEGKGA
jgi:Fe-S cluster assembly ATP-binding protein